jgi:tRNA-dihydrouridine synthase A
MTAEQPLASARSTTPPHRAHRFCVAPMMEWTDRHCRFFLRLLSRHALLYTEMVTSGALMHGNRERLIGFDECEQPLALQLGGSDPRELSQCAQIGEQWGYREINLNVGCPSSRVSAGRFGACLMAEPRLVADCVTAMRTAVRLPVTVKCRIGIDDRDSYAELRDFVGGIADAGAACVIVHARKALLQGLSPKQNREIPPLSYPTVYRLKQDFPALDIVLNGGIQTIAECDEHLRQVDGVMIGRAAYHDPYLLAGVDAALFDDAHAIPTRHEALEHFLPYVERELRAGRRLHQLSRHVLGLFQGCNGGKRFRRYIAENACREGAGIEVLRAAAKLVPNNAQAARVSAAI